MADVVHLHIGAPKTGTTYLQSRLLANHDRLAQHGVAYPVGRNDKMFGAAVDLIERHWGGVGPMMAGEWDALAKRVRETPGRAVISHEVFAGARPEHVKRALSELGDAEVHLVMSVRDLERQLTSEYQEMVKHRYGKTFGEFLRTCRESPRDGTDWWFWATHSVPDVLRRWAADLPPDLVHVVTVPRPGADGDLWARYCEAFRLDPAWLPQEVDERNTSLGIDETSMLRRLNRELGGADLRGEEYDRIVRVLLVQSHELGDNDRRPLRLGPDERPWVDAATEEWIDYLGSSGFDVIGDLDDLRPVRTDAEWEDPDDPEPALETRYALRAMRLLVQELAWARRDEWGGGPPDAPSVRARVARRVRALRSR